MTARRFNVALIFSLLFTLLLAAGCGSKSNPTLAPDAVQKEFVGKTWICESMFNRDLPEDSGIVIEFKEDGTVSGSGGCNNFTGTYTITGDVISFGPLATTKKACGPVLTEREYTFFTYLPRINRVKVDDDELFLSTNDSSKPMVFIEKGSSLW